MHSPPFACAGLVHGSTWYMAPVGDVLAQQPQHAYLRRGLFAHAGLVFGAALRPLREAERAFAYPPGAAFEVVGADFLIDGNTYRPWLVEINALPSMAVKASLLHPPLVHLSSC